MTDVGDAWRNHAEELSAAAWALFAANYSEWIGFIAPGKRTGGTYITWREGSLNQHILRRHFIGEPGDLIAMPVPFHALTDGHSDRRRRRSSVVVQS